MAATTPSPTSASFAGPDCVAAIRYYFERMLRPKDKVAEVHGMKALILDNETRAIIGMVYTMHEILQREVYLVEDIGVEHDSLKHLKAIVFVRPTVQNLDLLRRELGKPRYAEYSLFFSNMMSVSVDSDYLKALASADVFQVVKQVQEYFGDYYAITPDLFSLDTQHGLSLLLPRARWGLREEEIFGRCLSGVLSLLLSFKAKPFIRYQARSECAKALADGVTRSIAADPTLWEFGRVEGSSASTTLLIIDRREDPVSPLLSKWTYQAMVHDLIGIDKNTACLKDAPGIALDLHEVVLGTHQDDFFSKHRLKNFGDVGRAVTESFEAHMKESKEQAHITSIEDLQRFVSNYAAFKGKGNIVTKHVAVMAELSRIVAARALLPVSELEQSLACDENKEIHYAAMCTKLDDPAVPPPEALRLLLLFALRYETSADRTQLEDLKSRAMSRKGLTPSNLRLLEVLLAVSGAGARRGDLFSKSSVLARVKATVKKGLQGVENVYTRHEPQLVEVLQSLFRNSLDLDAYPPVGPLAPPFPVAASVAAAGAGNFKAIARNLFPLGGGGPAAAVGAPPAPSTPTSSARQSTVVVFIIGGATYEEAAKITALNLSSTQQPFVILGGSSILNPKQFLSELSSLAGSADCCDGPLSQEAVRAWDLTHGKPATASAAAAGGGGSVSVTVAPPTTAAGPSTAVPPPPPSAGLAGIARTASAAATRIGDSASAAATRIGDSATAAATKLGGKVIVAVAGAK